MSARQAATSPKGGVVAKSKAKAVGKRVASPRTKKATAPTPGANGASANISPAVPLPDKHPNLMNREELITYVFERLKDAPKATHLSSRDLRIFADLLDFKGTKDEWDEEFNELCLDAGTTAKDGLNLKSFGAIVNDQECSCYCSDDELRTVIAKLVKGEELVRLLKLLHRSELVYSLFLALDKKKEKVLKEPALRVYAGLCGFDGDDIEWGHEWSKICAEHRLSPGQGVDLADFARMVNTPDSSAFNSDEDLRCVMESMQIQAESIRSMQYKKFSRDTLIAKVYYSSKPLMHNDRVGEEGMHTFASAFEALNKRTVPSDWHNEYVAMCADHHWDVYQGVTKEQFVEFVSEKGSQCYCDIRRLQQLLVQLVLQGMATEEVLLAKGAGMEPPPKPLEFPASGADAEEKVDNSRGKDSLARRARTDVSQRIATLLRRRGSKVVIPDTSTMDSSYDHDAELRATEMEQLKRVQAFQNQMTLKEKRLFGYPDDDKQGGKAGRSTLLLRETMQEEMQKLANDYETQFSSQEAKREDAANRLQSSPRRGPPPATKGVTRAASATRGRLGTAPGARAASSRSPSSPGGVSQKSPGSSLSPSPKARLGSAAAKAGAASAKNAAKAKAAVKAKGRGGATVMSEQEASDVQALLEENAGKAGGSNALLEKVARLSAKGCLTDRKILEAVRNVWQIDDSLLAEDQVCLLAQKLDPFGNNKIPLRTFLEFARGLPLDDLECALLEETAGPLVDDGAQLDDDDDGKTTWQKPRGMAFEDSPLPPKNAVTGSYLASNPNFIIKVIKQRNEAYALYSLDRMTFRGVNVTDMRGCTLLHLAGESNLSETCAALLERGTFQGACAKDYCGWTALHRAARVGALDACKAMLLHPRFTLVDAQNDHDGWTALHLACMHGHTEVIPVFLSNSRVEGLVAKDNWGRTPLHAAAEHGHIEVVQALLSSGRLSQKDVLLPNKWNQTPVDTAAGEEKGNMQEVFKKLLERDRRDASGDGKAAKKLERQDSFH
eukprot:TRINITY_DN34846_c0_g1_i1.p1 TRINITY_DN34846_c0_g1~~TRINITY_DN34846_c0_g1_i1.p1  ORF type:complete len:1008 (+),score=284.27 TRINITY_DN34846_c0_g1_i1:134-3157(+)